MTFPSQNVIRLFRDKVRLIVSGEGEPAALGKSATGPVYYNDGTSDHESRVWFRKGANLEVIGIARADNMGIPDVPDLPIEVAERHGIYWVLTYDRNDPAASGSHVHDFPTRNVVVGDDPSTLGTDNTYMGAFCAPSAEAGALSNTVIGSFAGRWLTTGDRNTFVGRSAGASDTGSNNVAVGYSAGQSMTSAIKNVLIGESAGATLSGGGENTMVGYNAGGSGGSQEQCAMVGATAGLSTSGNRNTFLGYNAGGNLGGANNICIGYKAGTPSLPSGGNQLYIDTSGADDYPLVWGHFTNDNLGFIRFTDVAGGVGVIAIGNVTTAPTGTPTGGGVLYVEAGALKWKGSSGTVTTLGVA